jgi:uncharacterized RDD family membrane protein YckC
MSSAVASPKPKVNVRSESILAFSPESVRASFILRCVAIMIDYLVIVIVPVSFLLVARFLGEDGSNLLNGDLNSFGWLVAILLGVTDLIILPMALGQSLGKLFVGIRIVSLDGTSPRFRQILIRQTLGYILVVITLGVGFLISLFNRKGRALHDMISGTIVIQANKERLN